MVIFFLYLRGVHFLSSHGFVALSPSLARLVADTGAKRNSPMASHHPAFYSPIIFALSIAKANRAIHVQKYAGL